MGTFGETVENAATIAKALREKQRIEFVRKTIADLIDLDADEVVRSVLEIVEKVAPPEPEYEPRVMHEGLPDRLVPVVPVSKAEGEQQLVLGIVLEPDVVDSQGDTYSAEEIEKTAQMYLADYRNVGLQHKALINRDAAVVESAIHRGPDYELNGTRIRSGSWLMMIQVKSAELWQRVKAGELTGLSIAGFATRTPVA